MIHNKITKSGKKHLLEGSISQTFLDNPQRLASLHCTLDENPEISPTLEKAALCCMLKSYHF